MFLLVNWGSLLGFLASSSQGEAPQQDISMKSCGRRVATCLVVVLAAS